MAEPQKLSSLRPLRSRMQEGETLPLRVYVGADAKEPLENVEIDGLTWFRASQAGGFSVMSALILGGIDINTTDVANHSCTALHYAAAAGDVLIARLLLDNGASINAANSVGVSPLMVALQQGKIDMAGFLVERGADVLQKDDAQEPTLFYGAASPLALHAVATRCDKIKLADLRNPKGQSLIHVAAATPKSRNAILYLVEMAGASVNEQDTYGDTPLHFAARSNDVDNIKALMGKGADASIANNDGITPPNCKRCTQAGLINRMQSLGTATQRERLAQPDASNWANLDFDNVKHFLAFFLLPNIFCYIASHFHPMFCVLALAASAGCFMYVAQFAMKQPRRSLSTAGFFAGALAMGSYVLVNDVFPIYQKHLNDQGRGTPIVTLWWIVTPLMVIHYFRAVLGDPGAVPSTPDGRKQIYDVAATGGETELKRGNYDLTTLVRKPLRAKHCSQTHFTISRFDHFCVWTGNTIGGGNHRPFVWYCVCQCISQLCVMWITFSTLLFYKRYAREVYPGFYPMAWVDWLWHPSHTLVTMYLIFYNCPVIIFVTVMKFGQFWYASRNVTSNEVWFAERYKWMFMLGRRAYSYYDQGPCNNLTEFFWTGNLCKEEFVLPPISEHLQLAIHQHEARVASGQKGYFDGGDMPAEDDEEKKSKPTTETNMRKMIEKQYGTHVPPDPEEEEEEDPQTVVSISPAQPQQQAQAQAVATAARSSPNTPAAPRSRDGSQKAD